MDVQNNYDLFVRRWAWLFPFIYLFHTLEEYYGGLAQWMTCQTGVKLFPSQFLTLDAFFWTGMIAGITVAMLARSCRWLAVTFALAVISNSVAHLLFSITSMSYSPGLITGILFWLPLGIYTLFQAFRYLPRRQFAIGLWTGILAAVALHLLILMIILITKGTLG